MRAHRSRGGRTNPFIKSLQGPVDLAVELLDYGAAHRVRFAGVIALDVIRQRFCFFVLTIESGAEMPQGRARRRRAFREYGDGALQMVHRFVKLVLIEERPT